MGWNVFEGPGGPPERSADHFVASPFTRLARVHALQVAGDALIALALANSLFFSIPSGEARGQVALYLVLTMAPFAVIAPFIGPAIDRAANGRRLMVILIAFSRVLIGLFMIGNLDDLLLFPAALLMLVSGKAYGIAKSAIVPTTVSTDQELIEANSKLSIITGFSGLAAGIPGVILGWIGGPTWIIGFAIVVFALGTVLAFSLPQAAVAAEPVGEAEEAELRSRGIFLAASSMGLMRAIVGFLVFLLAFAMREQPTWHLGFAVGASVLGSFVGSILAPRVRRTTQEEDILVGSMLLATLAALLAAWSGGLGAAVLVAFAVGFSANTAKLAFDSIVQRDAPDANRGRSFAKFETRFQIFWVVGAFIPVVLHLPARLGFLTIAVAAGFAGVTYWIGRRDAAAGRPPRTSRGSRRPPRPPREERDRTDVSPPPDPTVVDDVLAIPNPGVVEDFLPPGPTVVDDVPAASEPDGAEDPLAPGPDRRPRNPGRRPNTTGPTRKPPGASRRRRPTQRNPRRRDL